MSNVGRIRSFTRASWSFFLLQYPISVLHAQAVADEPAPLITATPASTSQPAHALPRVGLQAALDEALSRELRVRVAQAEVERTEGLLQSARAGFLPTLLGRAAYIRNNRERSTAAGIAVARDQLNADVTLTVPLFAPRAWNDTGFASDNARTAESDLADTRRTVAISTAQAYLTVMAQHRSIEVTQRALDNANAHYQYAHQRLAGGIGNQVDDVRAAQEVATNAAQLERAQASLYAAQEALGYSLGRTEAVDADAEVKLDAPPNMEAGLSGANTLRGDVVADRAALSAQQNLIDDNWAEYMPLIVVQAQPFYREPGTLAQPHTGWQAQLILTLPIYDGGAREGVLAQRRATLHARQAQLQDSLRRASSEVRVAYNAVRHTDASLTAAKQAAGFASQALQFATAAYEAGASTNIEVVDAERRARDADTAVVIAEDGARQARLSLLAATGRFP
ncbi:MAG: TolC family protein [Polyangiales bacterium]